MASMPKLEDRPYWCGARTSTNAPPLLHFHFESAPDMILACPPQFPEYILLTAAGLAQSEDRLPADRAVAGSHEKRRYCLCPANNLTFAWLVLFILVLTCL